MVLQEEKMYRNKNYQNSISIVEEIIGDSDR